MEHGNQIGEGVKSNWRSSPVRILVTAVKDGRPLLCMTYAGLVLATIPRVDDMVELLQLKPDDNGEIPGGVYARVIQVAITHSFVLIGCHMDMASALEVVWLKAKLTEAGYSDLQVEGVSSEDRGVFAS
jgi:hypothetical protein